MNPPNGVGFKRYCKTLVLKEDLSLIEEYVEEHKSVWKEIESGIKEVGILNMELYLYGNRLFMIMDTISDFDHDTAMVQLAQKPRQKEWEARMARFQDTTEEASAGQKWQLMRCVYKLS